jgi:hypothetical protein
MVLHAQEYVAALYERHGFVRFGVPYEEAGIRHVGMYRAGAVRAGAGRAGAVRNDGAGRAPGPARTTP